MEGEGIGDGEVLAVVDGEVGEEVAVDAASWLPHDTSSDNSVTEMASLLAKRADIAFRLIVPPR